MYSSDSLAGVNLVESFFEVIRAKTVGEGVRHFSAEVYRVKIYDFYTSPNCHSLYKGDDSDSRDLD